MFKLFEFKILGRSIDDNRVQFMNQMISSLIDNI